MTETIETFPEQITGINGEKQAIVLVLLAHRTNAQGETVALTSSQKEAARNAAQAALEITDGTEVLGTSTALLLPNIELTDGETLTLNISTSIVKSSPEKVQTTEEVNE